MGLFCAFSFSKIFPKSLTMELTYLLPVLMLCAIGTPGVNSGSASGFNTPLNGWFKYACTAENIKVDYFNRYVMLTIREIILFIKIHLSLVLVKYTYRKTLVP